MEKILLSYALAKSMYDSGKDYFYTFIPFIIKILAYTCELYSIDKLKSSLEEEYFLDIPAHALSEICRKAINEGYVEYDMGKYYITKEGVTFASSIIDEREVERRANSLAEQFSAFLREDGFGDVSVEASLRILLDFINRNLVALASFIKSPLSTPQPDKGNLYSRAVITFLVKIEKSNPSAYQILVDLFYGSVVCTIVQARDEQVPRTLKNVNVFLDTNTVFSILGLHYDEINRPCQELLEFLKKEKCNLYVLNFTIDEMVSVLNLYVKNFRILWENVRVDTIYSSLKTKGKTPADVLSMIANLEDLIGKHGIKVFQTKYKLSEKPIEGVDISKLATYKPDNVTKSLNHDMLAINEIIRLRSGQVPRKLEKCKAIFVSSDNKLSKFNLCEYEHQNRRTISEVILDRALTQILWVKNPQESRLPIFSAIATHSRALLVDRVIWNRFYSVISKMYNEKELTAEELSLLAYSQSTEDLLIFEEDPENINEEYIKQRVELIRIDINEQKEEHLNKLKKSEAKLIAVTEAMRLKEEEALRLNKEFKLIGDRINKEAKRKAEIATNGSFILISIAISISCICYYRVQQFLSHFAAIIIPILGFLGISAIKIKKRIKSKMENRFIKELTVKYLEGSEREILY